MNILDTIIEHKKIEVTSRKSEAGIAKLKKTAFYAKQTFSLKQFLLDETKTGIIAEFKRKSPSKGIINDKSDIVEVTSGYTKYGASCLSILTDEKFFGGCNNDLIKARVNN